MEEKGEGRPGELAPDLPTLIAVSALAYVAAVALHEHGGHAVACVLLGSHPKELGAFYVDCDSAGLSSMGMRLVALAGPAASLLAGSIAFLVLRRMPPRPSAAYYFTWLLGGIGWMSASGYPLFSGALGIGDLGVTRDGLLFESEPQWLWRGLLFLGGLAAYSASVRYMSKTIAPLAGAPASAALAAVQRAALVSYFAGAVVYAAIGAFNPLGWTIVLESVLPSSLGGTCGLLWIWGPYARRAAAWAPRTGTGAGLGFGRSPGWIAGACAVVCSYAFFFGPSLRP